MSIAGNPAFGLRRRRVLDHTVGNGSETDAATSSTLAPLTSETRQHETPSLGEGLDAERLVGKRAVRDTRRRHPLTLKGHTPVRPTATDKDECSRGAGTPPEREGVLETPSAASGRAADATGGLDAEPAPAGLAPPLSRPLTGLGHDAVVGRCSTPGETRPGGNTPGASLCCRALLSPPTGSQQGPRCGRRWPPVAARGAAPTGAGCFIETGEANAAGVCLSRPLGAAKAAAAAVAANVYSRTCRGRAGPTREKPLGVLNSRRSAATLTPPANRSEAAADLDDERGREKQPTPAFGRCGGGAGTTSSPCIGADHPDGGCREGTDFRGRWRDGDGVGKIDGGPSSSGRQWKEDINNGRGFKPSEVPEWSPTASGANDPGVDATFREGGSTRGTRHADFAFRVCDGEREQVAHDGGRARKEGGGHGGGGSAEGGFGGSISQPFARMGAKRKKGVTGFGEGVSESDEKLVALLRERPKNVPQVFEERSADIYL